LTAEIGDVFRSGFFSGFLRRINEVFEAGAYTRPVFSST
jgi:hypothetical protein